VANYPEKQTSMFLFVVRPRKKLMAKAINGHFFGAIMDCSDLLMHHYGWPGSFTWPYGWIENEKNGH
jgi:hypothetical protein